MNQGQINSTKHSANTNNDLRSVIVCVMFFLQLGTALAQNYILKSATISNGAESATGTTMKVVPSVGQTFTGQVAGSGHILSIGFLATAIPRQAELALKSLVISPTLVGPGQSTGITFTLVNTGAVGINADISAEVYLSANSTFELADTRLDSFFIVTDLAAAASFDFPVGSSNKSITIPGGTPNGEYRLFVVLHTSSSIDEIDPVNVFPIVITIGSVVTGDTQPPVITTIPSQVFNTSAPLQVTINDASDVNGVLYYREITGDTFASAPLTHISGQNYTVLLMESWADDLGMEGYIVAEDLAGNSSESPRFFLYMENDPTAAIPFASGDFDGKSGTYQMFSIPYQLEDRGLEEIFNSFGGYDPNVWRVFHYGANGYIELGSGLNNIDRGKGYWFNTTKSDFDIKIGAGKTFSGNNPFPFTSTLRKGWNQIGNPYPFEISWSTVQSQNPGVDLGSLNSFVNGSYQKTDVLAPWAGAFVFSEAGGNISFSLSAKNSRVVSNAIEGYDWKLEMELSLNGKKQVSMIGIHPDASFEKDRFDEIAVPRFISYLEMTSHHPSFFAPKFTHDIVASVDHYEWTYDLKASEKSGRGQLSWSSDPNMKGKCFLIDLRTLKIVDMTIQSNFQFEWEEGRQLRFVYSSDGSLTPGINKIGMAYPNPFNTSLTIPVLTKAANVTLKAVIYNAAGAEVHRESKRLAQAGIHEYMWKGNDASGNDAADGIYLIKLELPDEQSIIRAHKKKDEE